MSELTARQNYIWWLERATRSPLAREEGLRLADAMVDSAHECIEELQAGLRPFADHGRGLAESPYWASTADHCPVWSLPGKPRVTMGDLRRAAELVPEVKP